MGIFQDKGMNKKYHVLGRLEVFRYKKKKKNSLTPQPRHPSFPPAVALLTSQIFKNLFGQMMGDPKHLRHHWTLGLGGRSMRCKDLSCSALSSS